MSLSKSYRYARWPLVKNTTVCVFWLLIGAGILVSPLGDSRWFGLLLVGYGLIRWLFSIRPRWKHVVILNEEKLVIGKRSYDWDKFDQMRIERKESRRAIHLTGQNGKLDLLIKDDLPGFEELAQDCFFYMNRKVEKTDSCLPNMKCT